VGSSEETNNWMHAFSEILLSPPVVENCGWARRVLPSPSGNPSRASPTPLDVVAHGNGDRAGGHWRLPPLPHTERL